jgi:hypothetical protein
MLAEAPDADTRLGLLAFWEIVVGWVLTGEWKKAGRDSSTAQADSFAGAKEEEKHRLAPLGMKI